MQPAQAKAERGFEAGDPVWRELKFNFLFVHGVRRVIGRNGVHNAIENSFDHGIAIGSRAQRRIHFGVRVVEADMLFGQQEVMRRNLAGHAQPVAPRLPHRSQRRGR